MKEEKKPQLTINQLRDNINMFLNKEVKNDRLINKIYQDFVKKGLPSNIPRLLFENNKDVESLTEDELIAFCISVNDFFKKSEDARKDEEHIKLMNPHLYFYDKKLVENEMLQPKKENRMDTIVFHGVQMLRQINGQYEMQTKLTAKQFDRLEKTGNLVYFKDVQRATKVQKLPNGEIRRVENYNVEGLKDLEERFTNKDILITQVSLTIIVFDKKTPDIDFIPYTKEHPEYGDFVFKPCFDPESPNYAFLVKNDGAHRESALINAYNHDKTLENEVLSVSLKVISLPVAKQFTTDTFKINETDITHKEALENTATNAYIDNIIKNSILKDKIAMTKVEEDMDDIMYGSYSLIKKTLEEFLGLKTEIKNKKILMRNMETKGIAKVINTIIENIEQLVGKSEEELKKETIYLNKYMCILYIMLGYKFKESSDETLYNIIMLLIEKEKELENICNLKKEKKMFEKFNELIEGVE